MKPKLINFSIALVLIAIGKPALAQNRFFDHVVCYKVSVVASTLIVNNHASDPLVITPKQAPPFPVSDGCRLIPRPQLFCVPADKTPRQAPTGTPLMNDFLVYRVRCPGPVSKNFSQGVEDQFIKGAVTVRNNLLFIQVPAYKTETPPTSGCDQIAVGQCGGSCQIAGDVCDLHANAAGIVVCSCAPQATSCGIVPSTNQCGGDCPTGMSCKTSAIAPCACG